MIISHRGNVDGKSMFENDPGFILAALEEFYVEVDVWYIDGKFFLGHDAPDHQVSENFLLDNNSGLFCHAKNLAAMQALKDLEIEHFFWHDQDDRVLTSSGYFWTFPGKDMSKDSIFVMPEIIFPPAEFEKLKQYDNFIAGYCTDYPRLKPKAKTQW